MLDGLGIRIGKKQKRKVEDKKVVETHNTASHITHSVAALKLRALR